MLKWMLNQANSEVGLGLCCIGRKWLVGLAVVCVLVSVGCGGGGSGGPSSNIVHQIDEDADGDIDMTWTFAHNAAGQVISMTAQEGTAVVGVIEYTYDASGNCELAQFYDGGVLDTTVYFTYNTDGEVTLAEIDEGSNDTMDGCTESMYDASGDIERREDDRGCDGSVEEYKTYGWNGDGNLLWMEEYESGTTDRVDFTYDGNGNLTTAAYDHGDDGSIDDMETLIWAAGAIGMENYINILYQDYSFFHPGRYLATYRMVRHLTRIEYDDGDNGIIDNIMYFYYGTNGRIARIEADEDNNGDIDHIEHLTW